MEDRSKFLPLRDGIVNEMHRWTSRWIPGIRSERSVRVEPIRETDLDAKIVLRNAVLIKLSKVRWDKGHCFLVGSPHLIFSAVNAIGDYYLCPSVNDSANEEISSVLQNDSIIMAAEGENHIGNLRIDSVTPLFLGKQFVCWSCTVTKIDPKVIG